MNNKKRAELTSRGIKSNIPKVSFVKSLYEYIWNGFDAGASIVEIIIERNKLNAPEVIIVKDNGNGIDSNTLNKTFSAFSDSPKVDKEKNSEIKGEKGKGRYYFSNFCRNVEWTSVYQDEQTNVSYKHAIAMSSLKLDEYTITKNEVTREPLGTEVRFTILETISEFTIEHTSIEEQLACEFAAFLHLNKYRKYKIVFDSLIVTYSHLINDTHVEPREIDGIPFKITYIQWNKKIGDSSFVYYLNNENKELAKQLSRFDDKKSKFYHSVYIESNFFNDYFFVYDDKKKYNFDYHKQRNLNDSDTHEIYTSIKTTADEILIDKHKIYFEEYEVEKLISEYKSKGIIPSPTNNDYDRKRIGDLISLIKEIYLLEPSIFKTLNQTQAKTMVGLFNLLLSSDSREEIIDFLSSYINMPDDMRSELHKILKKTSLEKITNTTKMIIDRLDVIERLKILIYDYTKFTTEREEIQKIIENNYWLFGEEFNLVSADKTFNHALYNFLISNGEKDVDKKELENISNRRPDILLCSNYVTSGNNSSIVEENLIIELKRTNVIIGEEEYRQLEDYKRIIFKSTKFNSSFKKWKFYIIGIDLEPSVRERYDSAKISGVKGLTNTDAKTFEIYALSWEDLFTSFRIRYRHILETLGIKEQEIINEIEIDKNKSEKEIVKELASNIIDMKKKKK